MSEFFDISLDKLTGRSINSDNAFENEQLATIFSHLISSGRIIPFDHKETETVYVEYSKFGIEPGAYPYICSEEEHDYTAFFFQNYDQDNETPECYPNLKEDNAQSFQCHGNAIPANIKLNKYLRAIATATQYRNEGKLTADEYDTICQTARGLLTPNKDDEQ